MSIREVRKQMLLLYGKNEKITGDYAKSLAIKCFNGTFVGEKHGSIVSYKGIPFALPPVGERRWKAPEPVEASDEIFEAKYFGPTPIQTELASERASLYVQSEDCLYLNIWLNSSNTSTNKPVYVFIHGGSYGWGGTSDPLYEGTNLIQKYDDIILVTVEYRTGLMGFMDFSFVEGGEDFLDACNAGLLDQVEALRWVQQNISAFGGDPNNVTVGGESAGGGSVSILPLMECARGLFQKVIAESGSVALTYSREEVHDLTVDFMKNAGAKNMDDLMALDEDQLMVLNKPLNERNNFPLRDGRILPENLYEAYKKGYGANITILSGTNSDEARYWISELGGIVPYSASIPVMFESNRKRISREDNKILDKFLELRKSTGGWAMTEFYTEIMFRIPAIEQAALHTEAGGKDFVYFWNYPSSIPRMGACHAVELAYVFNNLTETIYTGDNINIELANKAQDMWINFIRTGDPSTEEHYWPEYNREYRETMILGDHVRCVQDPLSEQRKLMEPILKYNFNGCYANLDFDVPYIKKIKKIGAVIAFILLIAILIMILL